VLVAAAFRLRLELRRSGLRRSVAGKIARVNGVGLGIRELGLVIYVAGVAWGLLMIDARPLPRIALAMLWPLGPIAFAVTITILLAASLIAFPLWGAAVVIVAVLAAWFWGF
jgi:hypothetical protein